MKRSERTMANAGNRWQRGRVGGRTAWMIFALSVLSISLVSCAPKVETSVVDAGSSADTAVTIIATAAPIAPPPQISFVPKVRPTLPGYKLVFHDEFIGSKLNTKLWSSALPWGSTNQEEAQYYTASGLRQHDGILSMTARRNRSHGKRYTSGAINTFRKFSFKYGRVEMRANVPAGTGLWPAFWLPTTVKGQNDEIDVLELLGSDPSQGYAVVHYGTLANKGMSAGSYRDPDFSIGYHTFAIDWEPGVIIWYVDGVERRRVESERLPSHPMYLIANFAVGGRSSWGGAPDNYTEFPARFDIDYVRVFQRK